MVTAAELQALHQQSQQQQQPQQPVADPFPALREQDPFPAPAATNGKAARNGHNGVSEPAAAAQQPDFNSQSLFPSLGASTASAKGSWGQRPGGAASSWSSTTPVIQRTVHQEALSFPSSEELSARLGQIIQRVQNKQKGVKIEASTTRKATTIVIKGANESSVKAAKRELTVGLARNVSLALTIPASLRAFVIGQKGKNLKAITEQTGVRIDIPKSEAGAEQPAKTPADFDYDLDEQIQITIDGDEVNARTARDMLSAIVAERTSRTTQRLTHIEHIFYPFIAGPKNANVARLEQEGDVAVRIPPRSAFLPPRDDESAEAAAEPKRERDLSIIVTGHRDIVGRVVQHIDAQVDEMRRSFRTLQISIPKRQHRFLVGDAAQEILASTDCSIELAPIDDPSDNVVIRGPEGKLPSALTAAMSKANAVRVELVDVGAAHRNLEHAKVLLRWLGRTGKLPREQDVQVYLPRAAIIESSGLAQIEIVGADASAVARVRSQIDGQVKSVVPSFVATVDIDPLLHRFIIGKKGANLSQYSKKGVDVLFPPAADALNQDASSNVLLILGDAEVIKSLPADKKSREEAAQAILSEVRESIEAASKSAADLKTETLKVPAKLHRAILGPGGTTLNAIIGEERTVAVKLGSSSGADKSASASSANQDEDTIIIRGPSGEVERVAASIRTIAKEAEEDAIVNGHTIELSISSQYVPHIVGRGGAGISKIREELGVRVDFDDANVPEGAKKPLKAKVVIVGRKENAEEAKKRILNQVERLADETTITLKVPENLHGSIIGQGGKYVTRLQDNYSVRINFPSQGDDGKGSASSQKPDEVVIKGGKKGVEAAKAELLELIEYEKVNNNVIQVPVSTKSIARIMGRGGANVNRIRDETEAQIDVDREDSQSSGNDVTVIRLRGTKEAIAAAKKAILSVAAEVDSEASYVLQIPARFHGQIIGPGGQNLRDIITKAGGDASAKTATQLIQFPRRGADQADVVTVRGPAELAGKVKEELEQIASELQNRVVVGVVVPSNQHRSLMGRIRELQSVHPSARIIVPGWREYDGLDISNADELSDASPSSIVKIQGSKEACAALRKEIGESFVSNTQQIKVPRAIAAKLAAGSISRRLRNEFGVSVDTGRANAADAEDSQQYSKPSQPAARIDDDIDEDNVDSLPFEVESINFESTPENVVAWTLSAKSTASLQEGVREVEQEVKRLQSYNTQARLWVDQRAIPRIVGRGGVGLRDIESQNDVSIDIPRSQNGLVIILGTQDSVEDARQRIGRIALHGGQSRGD